MTTARDIEAALRRRGTKAKAKSSAWFFKTAPGQYGYGDVFLGVTVPEQRRIAKKFRALPRREIEKLLYSKYHESRLTGIFILVDQFQRADQVEQKKIVTLYLRCRARINNWDLVDSSAPYILGEYLVTRPKTLLTKLVHSKHLWDRRMAVLAAGGFIRHGRHTETLAFAKILLNDKEDLIHKAVGWMLREVGKRDPRVERAFLTRHARRMPRTMLRYAIEKFPAAERQQYLKQ